MTIFYHLECFVELVPVVIYGLFPLYPDRNASLNEMHQLIKTFVCSNSDSFGVADIFLNLNKRIYLGISVTYDRNTRLVTCANNSQHKVHFNFSRIQPRYSTKPQIKSQVK